MYLQEAWSAFGVTLSRDETVFRTAVHAMVAVDELYLTCDFFLSPGDCVGSSLTGDSEDGAPSLSKRCCLWARVTQMSSESTLESWRFSPLVVLVCVGTVEENVEGYRSTNDGPRVRINRNCD